MSPLLHLLLLATTTITTPSTHHANLNPTPTTTTQRSTMAQPQPNISYPTRHPNQSFRGPSRIGLDASNPGNLTNNGGYPSRTNQNTIANEGRSLTPTEHTTRPR